MVTIPRDPRRGRKGKLTAVLDHQLRIGDAQLSDTIIAAYKERGLTPPEHIEAPPHIEQRFLVYWEAYQDLQTERVHPRGRIPIGAIASYAREAGVEVDTLKRIVWKVDEILLEHWAGQDKAARQQQKTKRGIGAVQ